MAYDLRTRSGHNMYDMSSMLQKAIRRGDFTHAGYAANELYYSFYNYLWKRLLVISAEDCYGIFTKEILALKEADDIVNAKKKKGEPRDEIFVSKAIVLLCTALKNRDACYFALNFMTSENTIDPDKIEHIDISTCSLGEEGIPEWVYDKHTITGKKNGKTTLDMIESEEEALFPHQLSLFDDGDWGQWKKRREKSGKLCEKDAERYPQFAKGKTHYE